MIDFRNFLFRRPHERWRAAGRVAKKVWHYAWPFLIGLVIVLGVPAALYGPKLKHLYSEAMLGKATLEKAKTLIVQQEFKFGNEKLTIAEQHLVAAQQDINGLGLLRHLPWLRVQVQAADDLLASGIATTNGISRLSAWAETVVTPFKAGKAFNLGKLTPDQKRAILKAIFEAQPDLQSAKASLDLALTHLDAIPQHGIIGPLAKAIQPFREQLPALQDGIAQAIPASRIIPPILGYPEPQTYLFLLQNNSELRPTGGFIGTYGILKVKDGEITSFTTDNVYNLDGRAKGLQVTPPTPLTTYNSVRQWYLRDSNWSPDFPTAAQTALSFYRREGGGESGIDGVIAVDPTFFQGLIGLTGAIKIGKTTFTSENLVDEIQLITGYAYVGKPLIDTTQRKEVIGQLGHELIARVMQLPKDRYGKVWTLFQQGVQQKHLLFWLADARHQATAQNLHWTGALQKPQGDDLAIVDANMGSLKTDPYVQRTITYSVQATSDGLIANLKVHYENTAKYTWKTSRYRTYTRVYVPLGSTLLESSGALSSSCNEKSKGTVTTSEEEGHVVFSAFNCTALGGQHDLTFRYRLGASPSALYQQGQYKLLVQKQAGTAPHALHVQVDFGKTVAYDGTLPAGAKVHGKQFTADTPLDVDKNFSITLK